MIDRHHVYYELLMLKNSYLTLCGMMKAKRTHDWQFYFNVCHENWCLHAALLLEFMNKDYANLRQRIQHQVLSLTELRTLPDHEERVLSPEHEGHEFIINNMKELGYE